MDRVSIFNINSSKKVPSYFCHFHLSIYALLRAHTMANRFAFSPSDLTGISGSFSLSAACVCVVPGELRRSLLLGVLPVAAAQGLQARKSICNKPLLLCFRSRRRSPKICSLSHTGAKIIFLVPTSRWIF